jgi:hypothetical protein
MLWSEPAHTCWEEQISDIAHKITISQGSLVFTYPETTLSSATQKYATVCLQKNDIIHITSKTPFALVTGPLGCEFTIQDC